MLLFGEYRYMFLSCILMNNKIYKINLITSVVWSKIVKVSEARGLFKQTSFCDEGPGFSKEVNPHLDYYWIRRGYISSHPGAMNLNTCAKLQIT